MKSISSVSAISGVINGGTQALDQFAALQKSRIDEVMTLMRSYPMQTLMALLRSGNAEVFANIHDATGVAENRDLIEQILTELKERANSLDSDAYDDLRAEGRLTGTFFETLHYVYEGFAAPGDNIVADYRAQRRRILGFLIKGVTSYERDTWNALVKQRPDGSMELDHLVSTEGKTENQIASDRSLVRGIVYGADAAPAERRRKGIRRDLLDALKRRRSNNGRPTIYDGYLRNAEGAPSTNVLELKMVYQKYFDLLRELTLRFPDARFLGNADIYTMMENTVNFRQTLRELDLFLSLTNGNLYVADAAMIHKHFGRLLDDAIPERFPWRYRFRVKVRQLSGIFTLFRLHRDRKAIILSPPLFRSEWRSGPPTGGNASL